MCCVFMFQMRSTRGGAKRGRDGVKRGGGGRRSPFLEFRAVPGAMRATPTGDIVKVESGKIVSPVTIRPRCRPSWAEEVEEEERQKVERERMVRERPKMVENKRVEREDDEEVEAASGLVEQQLAERVRMEMEMERLKRVTAEKERREKERAARREGLGERPRKGRAPYSRR